MRKIILIVPVSLDGFIEGPQRDLDWHKVDDELHRQFQRAARRDGLCRATTRALGSLSWCFPVLVRPLSDTR
jgi:hypothetical protein